MKNLIIDKKSKYSYIRTVVIILFTYLVFGYFTGYMYKPIIINDFNNQQYNNIVHTYNLKLQNNSRFMEIKYNTIMFDSFCVVKINNVNVDEFKKRNPQIEYCKTLGSIWFLPAGFHRPYGNKVSCYYIGDTIYISTCASSEIYGKKINNLFWKIYNSKYSAKVHREYYIHPLFVVFCCISIIALTLIVEKQHCNLQRK